MKELLVAITIAVIVAAAVTVVTITTASAVATAAEAIVVAVAVGANLGAIIPSSVRRYSGAAHAALRRAWQVAEACPELLTHYTWVGTWVSHPGMGMTLWRDRYGAVWALCPLSGFLIRPNVWESPRVGPFLTLFSPEGVWTQNLAPDSFQFGLFAIRVCDADGWVFDLLDEEVRRLQRRRKTREEIEDALCVCVERAGIWAWPVGWPGFSSSESAVRAVLEYEQPDE